MMGKTHVSVGVATALLVTQPVTLGGFSVAVIGGAIGGIISDMEVRSNPKFRDALHARFIALGLTVVFLLVDVITQGLIITSFLENSSLRLITGSAILIALVIFGRSTSHRTFTHSLLGLISLSAGVWLLCPPLTTAFVAGFISHVLLDLLNKQPIQIFYPIKKGKFCLKLFYANGAMNTVFLILGIVGSLFWAGRVALI
ncbi:metal-dependent hydrolase [Corynebacterium glutamicum]|uniref:metal-dependent hydrolase n=1 Tax=Corynebacterium glutamicum TaxID=1718 RepID=UPI000944FEDF|nr:metal-dependent hydrolase [Corynebacterium glutamicum]OKX85541.1 hypothetical protein AUO96_11800 [Corynebacterium glutamicum]QDX76352.1 hypothetical protein AKL15_11725 [Corynebacterium glutamicum]QDX79129.1 hypothetical protein AKL16_11730 [Corynebacterium glutamicum]TWS33171.1 hypothetical protein AKJ19_10180 [Corynebacterium glutamicum]TWS33248.1 hypothetical protein AKJ20_10165 [Corynebacterium glutamicum]